MHAYESVDVTFPAERTRADESVDALVVLIARRLTLGVDVAAAKFIDGASIGDPTREQEILAWIKRLMPGQVAGREIALTFFHDQILANKAIQQGLHDHWRREPADFPARRRSLTREIRPELDTVNRNLLLLLPSMPQLPGTRLADSEGLLDSLLSAHPSLRRLEGARHDATTIALRSLGDVRL